MFAVVHGLHGLRITLASQFVAGLLYGVLYLRSRSIVITSAAHYAYNAAGRLAMRLVVGM